MGMSSRKSILDTMFNVKHEVIPSGIVAYNEVTIVYGKVYICKHNVVSVYCFVCLLLPRQLQSTA